MERSERRKVREFGIGLLVVLAALSLIRLWRGHEPHFAWFLGIGGAVALAAIFVPRAVRPVYRGWMVIARGLLWFNTRLLLSLVFFVLLTPLAIVFRILRRDPLERSFDPGAPSYWKKRPTQPPARVRLRRQF